MNGVFLMNREQKSCRWRFMSLHKHAAYSSRMGPNPYGCRVLRALRKESALYTVAVNSTTTGCTIGFTRFVPGACGCFFRCDSQKEDGIDRHWHIFKHTTIGVGFILQNRPHGRKFSACTCWAPVKLIYLLSNPGALLPETRLRFSFRICPFLKAIWPSILRKMRNPSQCVLY